MMRERIKAFLTHPYLPWIAAGAAIILTLPSLTVGWQVDDYYHRGILLERLPIKLPLLSMFGFFHDKALTQLLIEQGRLPWWTLEDIRLSFFRPVAIFTHWLDYQIWPNSAPLQHLHNLIWYGVLTAAVTIFYRRIMGANWAAGLAALMFAFDAAHGFPVGWIANRNALIATTFGVFALIAHDRWRRDGWNTGAWLSAGLLMLALLSAEFGVGAFAFFISYALFLDPAPWRRRWRAIAPSLLTILIWQIAYRLMGYGAYGSSFYIDPGASPIAFLYAFIKRAPLLLQSQWFGLPAAPTLFISEWLLGVYWKISLGSFTIIAVVLFPFLRTNRQASFWTLSMALALVPVCAVFPAERVLFFVGIGAFPLFALLIQTLWQNPKWPVQFWLLRFPYRIMIYILVIFHVILNPFILPVTSLSPKVTSQWVDQPAMSVPNSPEIETEDWIILNPPVSLFTFHMDEVRVENHLYKPKSIQPIASGLSPFQIHREDEYTLTIRPQDGYFASEFERLLRGDAYNMPIGYQVKVNSFTATVFSLTPDLRPLEIRFQFSKTLEDPSLRFLQWKDNKLALFPLPAIGESIHLNRVRMF